MSIDYGEMERQFIETLKADSGRALDEWMAAIASEGLSQRNDIIDWLRRQGFMFSKASWLERIHNNGGRPIYTGATATSRAAPRQRRSAPRPAAPTPAAPPPAATTPLPSSAPAPARPAPMTAAPDTAALEALLARAKAFRPLAVYLIAEVRKQVPDSTVSARDGYAVFRRGEADFASLAISAKELRLSISLRAAPRDGALEPVKQATLRGAPAMTHLAVLTDARQVTPALLADIAQAAARA